MQDNKHYIDPSTDFSRFAELEELEKEYTYVEFDVSSEKVNPQAGLGIEVNQDKNGEVKGSLIDGSDTNTIIVSSTGSGKTRRILSNYMLSCVLAKHSFVVHDPKGELYGFFYKALKSKGYDIRVLNLRDPMTGDRLNFLEEAAKLWKKGKEDRAIEIACEIGESLYFPIEDADDKFWTTAAINLFCCYFIIAASLLEPEYVTIGAIYNIHVQGLEKMPGQVSKIQTYLEAHKGEKCYELGMPSITASDKTRQSIFSVFSNGLAKIILNREIEDMLTKSTFKVEDMVSKKKPVALFLITRDDAPKAYATVVSSIVNMVYTTLIDIAHTKYNRTLPKTVHFLLEEFGNIAALSNINDMMTASRSREIRFVIVVQSLYQLNLIYGKGMAYIIIGNTQNLVYMSSTDMELVRIISERCGSRYDQYTNSIRPLLSPDRLMHLDKESGETLFLLGRHYPYISYLPDLSCYKMIEPMEIVKFKKRERIIWDKNFFSNAVKKMRDDKIKELLDEDVFSVREKNGKISNGPKLQIPKNLLNKMNKIVHVSTQ